MAPKTPTRPKPPKVVRAKAPRPSHARLPRPTLPARPSPQRPPSAVPEQEQDDEVLEEEKSILDLIDNLLNQGVVLNGELVLGVAGVDLVYLRLSALLAAADRVLPQSRATNAASRRQLASTGPRPLLPAGLPEDLED